jgi:YHS domain-containing protein
MEIEPADAVATRSANGSEYYFCSNHCVEAFDADPAQYIAAPAKVTDPVCGMEIDPAEAAQTREAMGQTFYFCSDQCAETFDADPHQYMRGAAATEPAASALEKPIAGSATTGYNPDLPGPLSVIIPIAKLDHASVAQAIEHDLEALRSPGHTLGGADVCYQERRLPGRRSQSANRHPESALRFVCPIYSRSFDEHPRCDRS